MQEDFVREISGLVAWERNNVGFFLTWRIGGGYQVGVVLCIGSAGAATAGGCVWHRAAC